MKKIHSIRCVPLENPVITLIVKRLTYSGDINKGHSAHTEDNTSTDTEVHSFHSSTWQAEAGSSLPGVNRSSEQPGAQNSNKPQGKKRKNPT